MDARSRILWSAATAAAATATAGVLMAQSTVGPKDVAFPTGWEKWQRYQIVSRHDTRQYRELYAKAEIVQAVREGKPIPAMAGVARDEGAEAVTLVNTMPGLLDRRLGNGSGGLSGPALLPIGVLATRRVRERVGMPVIGVGGVRNTADVREYLAAGASLVAIGTAALADPRVPVRIARELAHA